MSHILLTADTNIIVGCRARFLSSIHETKKVMKPIKNSYLSLLEVIMYVGTYTLVLS